MTNDYRDMVRLKLSNVAKNRNLQEVEVEESRPLKKVLFDTTGFLGTQNLTQEQRDSRQNLYDNTSKEQCFEAICEHITAVQ